MTVTDQQGANAAFEWDAFDSEAYVAHNYRTLRDDDKQIIEVVRDFLSSADLPQDAHGIDVGSGTNLYPALLQLPFCRRITLWEHSAQNVAWLEREIGGDPGYSSSWDPFWEVLEKRPAYSALSERTDPRSALRQAAKIVKGSLYELPAKLPMISEPDGVPGPACCDVGTMFFVAESISTRWEECADAMRRFVGTLRPGAPFAAAFMENSKGYEVGDRWFPAFAISTEGVRCYLESITSKADLIVHRIETRGEPVRLGYSGMIIACGRVR